MRKLLTLVGFGLLLFGCPPEGGPPPPRPPATAASIGGAPDEVVRFVDGDVTCWKYTDAMYEKAAGGLSCLRNPPVTEAQVNPEAE